MRVMISREQGFTLIEVLVSLLVLAVGLLGMAALMMTSLQTNQSASMRSTATILAYDIAERIRNNPSRTDSALYATNDPSTAVAPSCDANAGCTTAQQAALDLSTWSANLQTGIPGSTATIQQIDASNFCIVIFWTEPTEGTNDNPCGQAAAGRAFTTMQVSLWKD